MKLYLLRHGLTEANARRLYYGKTDLPLSAEGRALLKAAKKPPAVAAYYTSGLRRADETLRLLCPDAQYAVIPELREMDFGRFEMRGYEELKDDPDFRRWCAGDNERNRCPDGESAAEVTERALRGLRPVLLAGKDALCVTHGGVIAGVMCAWFGGNRFAWTPPPGDGYRVELIGLRPVRAEKHSASF